MFQFIQVRKVLTTLLLMTLTACGQSGGPNSRIYPWKILEAPPEHKPEYDDFEKLAWEKVVPGSRAWSNYLFFIIDQEAPDLLSGAEDLGSFCPNYTRLNREEKITAWGFLFAELTRYESSFNHLARYHEKGRQDAVTGGALYSEGLLQLSYQDIQFEPKCEFDWKRDQHFDPTDPNKTVLNPFRNLRCGVLIMNGQIKNQKKIVLGSKAYWAVLKSTYSENKIKEIQKAVRETKLCMTR